VKDLKEDVRGGMPSGSDWAALEKCPFKFQAERGRQEAPSDVATKGVKIHDFLKDPNTVGLSERDQELASQMLDERNALLRRVWPDWEDCPPEFFNEQRIRYRDERYSGEPDVLAVKGSTGFMLDYKTGPIPVQRAPENSQLKAYAVLAAFRHKLDQVYVAIIQPLCGPPHTYFYDKANLAKARRSVTKTLRAVESKDAVPVAGVSQCRYCKAKVDCPAAQKAQSALMALSTLSSISGEKMSDALAMLPVVEGRCKAIKEEAHKRLNDNVNSIPGYTHRSVSPRRKIKNPLLACERLVDKGLIEPEGFIESCSVTVPKLISSSMEYCETNRVEAQFAIEDALGDMIEVESLRPRVVER